MCVYVCVCVCVCVCWCVRYAAATSWSDYSPGESRDGRSLRLFRNNDRSTSYARYEYWRVNAMKGKYLESGITRVDSIRSPMSNVNRRGPIRCPVRWQQCFADCRATWTFTAINEPSGLALPTCLFPSFPVSKLEV